MRLSSMRNDGYASQISTIGEVSNTRVGHFLLFTHMIPDAKSMGVFFLIVFENCA